MKRLIWGNLILGSWLMIAPFIFRLIYPRSFRVRGKILFLDLQSPHFH